MLDIISMRQLTILGIVILVLSGCGPGAVTKESPDQISIDPEQQAREYLLARNYSAAAEEYLLLAEHDTKNTESYRLKAAGAYIEGNEIDPAKQLLADLERKKLTGIQITQNNILHARIAISENSPAAAINWLDIELPVDSSRPLLSTYHETRAIAYEQNEDLDSAVNERLVLEAYLDTAEEFRENYQSIWHLLSQIPVPELEQQRTVSTGDTLGWLELAILTKTMLHNRLNLETAIEAWNQRYPGHAAREYIVPEIFTLTEQVNLQPRQIALLLPFGAQYRDISLAIREGFLAAWYEGSTDNKPIIKIYDTDKQNILATYQNAVADGADFIVGPLEKEAVAELISNGNLPVKTLALNQHDIISEDTTNTDQASVLPAVFQFGLLPEDEAFQAAERAWFDGHAYALVITPETTWGDRLYNAFNSQWEKLGGKILERARISADTQDYSTPVKLLLNIDKSEQRAKELTTIMGRKIDSEPRRRQDADFIFIAATPVMARQLIPQLRYYRADDIDAYSISSVYSGVPDPEADNDINNVVFADMPWVVDPGHVYSPLQQTLNNNWEQNESAYRRLYAFGIDAYRIIPHLGRLFMQNERFEGETGLLKATKDGRIQRQLTWTKFVNGTPQLLDAGSTH